MHTSNGSFLMKSNVEWLKIRCWNCVKGGKVTIIFISRQFQIIDCLTFDKVGATEHYLTYTTLFLDSFIKPFTLIFSIIIKKLQINIHYEKKGVL